MEGGSDGGAGPGGPGTATTMPMAELERALLDDVESLLEKWRLQCRGRPELERRRLLLLALEREQIVAVAYREEAVAGRVSELLVPEEVRALIRQTLVWIWKDEQLHAEYLRGELLRAGGFGSAAVVYGRQVQGALSGWTSATSNHREVRTAPLRAGAAGLLVAVAGLTGQIPPLLRRELRYPTFRRYCELNVALEASAELAYRRLVELSSDPEERRTIDRIRGDEARHTEAFRLLAHSLTPDDRLVETARPGELASGLAAISVWFLPAHLRPPESRGGAKRPQSSFGSRRTVAVGSGRSDADKVGVLERCLDAAGLPDVVGGAQTAAVRLSFMLGYDRRDRSNVNDPALVRALAVYLRRHGVRDVAVLEAPTVYGNTQANRSVASVADYFGFDAPEYRLVDIGADLRPFVYERGFVQHAISGTWIDADVRIVMPKLRTDPTEYAHLSLSTLEGSTGRIDATFYAGRQVDFRSATMMLLDVAPPDFAVVDAWAPVAQGPFGVMGCHSPAEIRHVYAGADVLSVDEAVLADLGVTDPRRAPIVRLAYHWFGFEAAPFPVAATEGPRPDLGRELRGAHASRTLSALGALGYPVYVYLSNGGERFVPAFDSVAFPPLRPVPAATRAARWAAQQAFGIRAP
jgi:uncharacterized protein (DUF362 family)